MSGGGAAVPAGPVTVEGILLEGLNYSGKTTVARRLVALLAERGVAAGTSRCHVSGEATVLALHDAAFASLPEAPPRRFPDARAMRAFNALRSALMMVDAEALRRAPPRRVHVQDRYWLTQHGNNAFFTPGEGFLSDAWLERSAPRFTVQAYLTCSPPARRRRAAARGPVESHRLNRYLRDNLERFEALEEPALAVAAADPSWEVLDTDGASPDELATHLLARLDRASGSAVAGTGEGRR